MLKFSTGLDLLGPIHLPYSVPISLKSIIMVSFHHFPVFQIKVFQQVSSPKFHTHSPDHYIKTISFQKIEALSSLATAMTAPSLTLLMPLITCSEPSVQVAVGAFQPFLVNSAVRSVGKRAAAVT